MAKAQAPEVWRDIPGYGGAYQASSEGRIRRIGPRGKKTMLRAYARARPGHANRQALRVKLREADGRRVERPVLKLVAETFFRVAPGTRAVHRNGMRSDNSIGNIMILPNRELGTRYGDRGARRPVVKIDRAGRVVDCYSSARAAARENYLSYQAVMDRCNGKVKAEFELSGYSYRWDEE